MIKVLIQKTQTHNNIRFIAVTCEGLSIANGGVNYLGGQYAGGGRHGVDQVAHIRCNQGYSASNSQSTCTVYGVWNPPNPRCIPSNENSILL